MFLYEYGRLILGIFFSSKAFITALEQVGGPILESALDEQRVPDDDADNELDDDFDEGLVNRMRVFRA